MKNKAFTLIELLAVIVILAIIALIATPIILGIIKDARDSANLKSAELYLGTAKLAIARINIEEELGDTTCTVLAQGNMNCTGIDEEVVVQVSNPQVIKGGGTLVFSGGKLISVEGLKIGYLTYRMNENGNLVVVKNNQSSEIEKVEDDYVFVDEDEDTSDLVSFKVYYNGLPEEYSNYNIDKDVVRGRTETISGVNIENYTLKSITIVGNETQTLTFDYEFTEMTVAVEIDTIITLNYELGEKKPEESKSDSKDFPDIRRVTNKGNSNNGTPLFNKVEEEQIEPPKEEYDDSYLMDVEASGPVQITFDVSRKAEVGDRVTLLHYKNGEWENLGSKIVPNNYYVTWTLESYSPYMISVEYNIKIDDLKKNPEKETPYLFKAFQNRSVRVYDFFTNKIETITFKNDEDFERKIEEIYGNGAFQKIKDASKLNSTEKAKWIEDNLLGYIYFYSLGISLNILSGTGGLDQEVLFQSFGQIYGEDTIEKLQQVVNDLSSGEDDESSILINFINNYWIDSFGNDNPVKMICKCLVVYIHNQFKSQSEEEVNDSLNLTSGSEVEIEFNQFLYNIIFEMSDDEVIQDIDKLSDNFRKLFIQSFGEAISRIFS